MEDDFDKWNEEKKKIHFADDGPVLYPKEKEVWLCSVGKNIGFEQNGGDNNFSRPVLVVKKFNNKMFWAVPLSTKQKKYDFFYNFTDVNGQPASVILAQLRLTSVKRFLRKIYEMPENNFNEITKSLSEFMKNRNPS